MDILIVDDHPIVRKGLKLLIEAEEGWRVVGQAADGAAAVRCVSDLRPEIAIVDLNLPDTNGIDVSADIRGISPKTRIIILSMHMNDFYIKAARNKGASAYVSKHVAEQEIVKAIKAVSLGRNYPEKDESLIMKGSSVVNGQGCGGDAGILTAREAQVLQMLAAGAQNKDVAQQLKISVRTAEKHRGNVMRKLNLKSHAELIHFALHNDIIDLPKHSSNTEQVARGLSLSLSAK